MPFSNVDILPFLRRARTLTREFEARPRDFDRRRWRELKRDLLGFVEEQSNAAYTEFQTGALVNRRGIDKDEVPEIFPAIRDRFIEQWKASLNRLFAFADDSIDNAKKGQSIFQRVVRKIRNAVGIQGKGGFREQGTFTFGGKKYWIYMVQHLVSNRPVERVKVETIRWLLRQSNLVGSRIESVDTSKPIIVFKGSRWRVLDGVHRLAKAVRQGKEHLPVRFISRRELEQARVEVTGLARRRNGRPVRVSFLPQLKLLFKTLPRNMERELSGRAIRMFDPRPIYRVVGGVVENSAHTCEWVNGKVVDGPALDFITKASVLKDHLFHPNCRHRVISVGPQFRGKVWTRGEIENRVRNGRIQ